MLYPAKQGATTRLLSGNQPESRVKPSQIKRIARNYGVAGTLRADHDVSVCNVRSSAPGQKYSDGLGVGCVQRHYVSLVMLHQAPKTHLLRRIAKHLGQSSGGNNDAMVAIQRHPDNGKNSAIISLQRDEAAGIERNTRQAAFPGVVFLARRFWGESILVAHARSFGVSGPPVSFRPWSIMALNSDEFRRDR
ncbi:MAG: hypothetical protein NTZ56_14055 [Acidobacteria bacterium]|nr:hypothetical protein [Acidobacteriota bacterium]